MLAPAFHALLMLAAAGASPQVSADQLLRQVAAEPPPGDAAMQEAQRRISERSRYPEDDRFEWNGRWVPAAYRVSRSEQATGYLTCGRVWSRYAYGGAGGWKDFLVVARGGDVLHVRVDGGVAIARSHCAAFGIR